MIRAVTEEVGGKMTIIAHVGACATDDAVELASYAAQCGVDAISSGSALLLCAAGNMA